MAKEFPYQDGDVTVLGPEIFASDDGTVISWKGDNYVPQNRLRLAHQARRAKEHQLDDIGFMDDDDPYSHADLANVIRQNDRCTATEGETVPRVLFEENARRHQGAIARVDELLAAITRVRSLHHDWEADPGHCAHCQDGMGTPLRWPCPTIRALEG